MYLSGSMSGTTLTAADPGVENGRQHTKTLGESWTASQIMHTHLQTANGVLATKAVHSIEHYLRPAVNTVCWGFSMPARRQHFACARRIRWKLRPCFRCS